MPNLLFHSGGGFVGRFEWEARSVVIGRDAAAACGTSAARRAV